MLSLLIADASDDFVLALSNALKDKYRIYACTSGKEALTLLIKCRPDILVIDLSLPELDGLSLLFRAVSEGADPMVLATTPIINPYIVETAENLGVAYLMRKPCDMRAITERIADLHQHLKRPVLSPENPRAYISEMLLQLDLSAKLRGYNYLLEAILLMADNPGMSVTKDLYPTVGQSFCTTGTHVERCIRSAIASAWDRRDKHLWQRFSLTSATGERPSNGEFISRLAQHIIWGNFAKIRL